jgi:putative peptidoglycan lipid II flippase
MLSNSVRAAVFGATVHHDAFLIAYRIPNLLREMLAEGALGSSFTKVFSSLWEQDEARARKVLMDSLWLTTLALTIVCGIGMIAAPWLVSLLTVSSGSNQQGDILVFQATGMTRLLFPFILFMSVGAVASGALHQRGQFFLSSTSSIALNLGFILGCLGLPQLMTALAPEWIDQVFADRRVVGLCIGVLFGGLLQLLLQLSGIWRPLLKGRLGRPTFMPISQDVKKVVTLMGPMVIASSSGLINVLINSNFATSLNAGAVTWIDNAFRVIHLPIGIFGVALGTVALPSLTQAVARAGGVVDKGVSQELQTNLELILWLILPSLGFIMLNSFEIAQLLYEYGRTTESDAHAISEAMFAFSFGILGLGSIKVLTSFYYAINRTGYAMRVSLLSIAINFLANHFLVQRLGHVGLAMTASIVVNLNATLLLLGMIREKPIFAWDALRSTILLVFGSIGAAWTFRHFASATLLQVVPNTLNFHIRAAVSLALNGAFLVSCFFGAAMVRYRLGIGDLLGLIKNRGRRPAKG